MYKKIYVPVDNSDYSNQAIRTAIALGRSFGSSMVGSHVYAAKMHDYRFRQMEYTLPDEYLDETELDRQRKIHDSLITMGLELISDSYLASMQQQCGEAELEFTPKMMDGKHHVEILRDIQESDYDLTVLGVLGIGRVRDSQIGSVCERVARQSGRDVWVVKRLPESAGGNGASGANGAHAAGNGTHGGNGVQASGGNGQSPVAPGGGDTILVGIDGSPQSFGALMTAIELAARFDKKVETIAVYDPYLHYSVFNGVVNVLTEKAAKVFRFEEQNQLHEEIIDCGLAQIYQSHLDVAGTLAQQKGVELTKTLLDGKAFQKILDHVRKIDPWLLVVGRIGVHSDRSEPGLGSNAENLLRSCPCDVLLTTRLEYPELDIKAEESIRWTPEAEERMQRVPDMVRGVARTAIYRLAMEQGHSVISSDVLDEAMERYMPKASADLTTQLAEKLAIEVARSRPTSICKSCGVTAGESEPVRCGVCGGSVFEVITPEMLERIAAMEGGVQEETTYDGRKLQWTQDAKRALWTMKDAYKRRRAKARVEKTARMKRLSTITLEFAQRVVEEESGVPLELPPLDETATTGATGSGPSSATGDGDADPELKLRARDEQQNPLLSTLEWTPEAIQRLFRVPSGYMRDKTQQRAETLAAERGADAVDLALVEGGIEIGRRLMEEMLAGFDPGSGAAAGGGAKAATEGDSDAPSASRCPFSSTIGVDRGADSGRTYLNEVGLMSAMEQRRAADAADGDEGRDES